MKHVNDIPLGSAIIGIDVGRNLIAVLRSPDSERRREVFPEIFGACDPYWEKCDAEQRSFDLLVQAWLTVVLKGLAPKLLHEALLVIPEYRELIPPDTLPKRYRSG